MEEFKKSHRRLLKYDDTFLRSFWDFKISLTDTPFGTKSKYSEERVDEISARYRKLLNKLYECKLSLFS